MTNEEKIKVVKILIENKKWQIENENRLDNDSLQKEVKELEIELKGLEEKKKDINEYILNKEIYYKNNPLKNMTEKEKKGEFNDEDYQSDVDRFDFDGSDIEITQE